MKMRYGHLAGIERPISRIVLGTSGFREPRAWAILDAFVEAGGTCLDTAHAYSSGTAEAIVGAWLRRSQCRDRLVIIAKGAHPPACHPDAIACQLEESLDRLGTARADLYMLHRDNTEVPVAEFVDALEAVRRRGLITAFGVSNWTMKRVGAANDYARRRGLRGVVAMSNHFSLGRMATPLYAGCQSLGDEERSWLVDADIALFPWSSQARGYFSDRPLADLDPRAAGCWDSAENCARRSRARQLGRIRGVSRINVALAFVLAQAFLTFPIIGPQTADELRDSLGALNVDLSAGEISWLEHGRGQSTSEQRLKYPALSE
jgi:aryl-alcohol dehydrogenase-like predicted oxidoreductase